MNTEIISDAASQVSPDRRKAGTVEPLKEGHLTIAQSIRRSSDPHRAAVTSFSRQEILRGQKRHVYYFEDRSFLTFEVIYLPIEDGGSQ